MKMVNVLLVLLLNCSVIACTTTTSEFIKLKNPTFLHASGDKIFFSCVDKSKLSFSARISGEGFSSLKIDGVFNNSILNMEIVSPIGDTLITFNIVDQNSSALVKIDSEVLTEMQSSSLEEFFAETGVLFLKKIICGMYAFPLQNDNVFAKEELLLNVKAIPSKLYVKTNLSSKKRSLKFDSAFTVNQKNSATNFDIISKITTGIFSVEVGTLYWSGEIIDNKVYPRELQVSLGDQKYAISFFDLDW